MYFLIKCFNHRARLMVLMIALMACCSNIASAQFYPPTLLYRTVPYGDELCSAQTITVHLQYWGPPTFSFHGMVRWYANEWGSTPVEEDYIDYETPVDYSFYAFPGQTISYQVYDATVPGWSQRLYYMPEFNVPLITFNEGIYNCDGNPAQVRARSNWDGVTYELYYSPNEYNYYFMQSNQTGDFDIANFNSNDKANYYVKSVAYDRGCDNPTYYRIPFEVTIPAQPSVTGNLTWCEGSPPVLTANGSQQYTWYCEGIQYVGSQFTPPSTLTPGNHNISISGGQNDGCITNVGITTTINPRPVDGTITASSTFVYTGDPVTISNQGGFGTPHYWGSSDGGAHWDLFADAHLNEQAFTLTIKKPGTYRFHVRNNTSCGYCWDSPAGCTTFPYVDVTVVDRLDPNSITPAELVIPAGVNPGIIAPGEANGGGCNGNYQYQWQQSTDGVNFSDIPSANGLTYEPPQLSATVYYRRRVLCASSGLIAFTNSCHIAIGSVDVDNLNYIRTRDFTRPGIGDVQTAADIQTVGEVKQTTEYFDGLGKTIQIVNRQAGKGNKDVVVPMVYDEHDLQTINYLPYVSPTGDGKYKPNAAGELNDFHKVQNAGESFYYGRTLFEPSPLKRVDKVMPAGDSWVGSNRGVQNKYLINMAADDVKIWTVANVAGGWGSYSVTGAYAEGQLYKSIKVDEKGNQEIQFKDKDDRLILKKLQLTATADDGTGTGYTNWLCTYYIYDDLNLLRAVIQPKGVQLLVQNGWNINALNGDILNEQCFRYEYDARKRMTVKKVPGAGESYLIYDARDRLVFSQDANLRQQSKWLVNLYDNKNRPVLTALTTYGGSAAMLQQLTTQNTNGTVSRPQESIIEGMTISNDPLPDGKQLDVLTKTGYDNYSAIPAQSGLTGALDNTYTTSAYLNTNTSSFPFADPVVQSNQTRGMTTWTQTRVLGTSQFLYSVNIFDEKGRAIQVKTTNVTGGTNITTTQYTFSGQPLVLVEKQEKGGGVNPQTHITVTKNNINALGQVEAVTKRINSTINGTAVTKPEINIVTNEYDPIGQLWKKNIGTKKDAAGNYTSDAMQTLTYDYNIRGWLLGANRGYLVTEGQTNDGILFGFELGYDKLINKAGQNFAAGQYTGNITGMLWKSDGDDIRRKYDLTYDNANRLLQAGFTQQNADDHQWNNGKVDFTVKMGDGTLDPTKAYDANGNILRMQQWGLKLNASAPIDDLKYHYNKNDLGNKLMAVDDDKGSGLGDFNDKNNAVGVNDYGYDANGNLVADLNKGIGDGSLNLSDNMSTPGAITYNHLNLPQAIAVKGDNGADKGRISYTYDAAGNKLQKTVVEYNVSTTFDNQQYAGDVTTTTTYLDRAVYETRSYQHQALGSLGYTDKLQFISHEEGRARYVAAENAKPAHYEYDYFVKDHLGNVRMVLTEQKDDHPYLATMETGARAQENQLFDNLDVSQYPASTAGFPGGGAEDPNETVAHVNGNTQKKGPGMVLKVMAGDVVDIGVRSLYHDNAATQPTANLFNDILASLAGGIVSTAGVAKGTLSQLSDPATSPLAGALTGFRQNNNQDLPGKPKAYLNWILVDEQFKGVNTFPQSGAIPVGAAESVTPLRQNGIDITKNGYLYIYVSNETENWDVFFDDLAVTHHTGPLLEETHYYPFGLTMAGISSKAIKTPYYENKRGFNGNEMQNKEFSDGSGLETLDFNARMYDPQAGRFFQMDPLSDLSLSLSPYNFSSNNPINRNDPSGLKDTVVNGQQVQRDKDLAAVYVTAKKNPNSDNQSAAGRFWRRHVNHILKVPTRVSNLVELGANSMLRTNMIWLTGDLLERVKNDPAMVAHQREIVKLLKTDPRFKKFSFIYLNTGASVQFGGNRAVGEDWFGISDQNPLLHKETWEVAADPLTWTLRHANIQTDAVIKEDGTIIMTHYISDKLDLRPGPGHTEAYNTVTSALGPIYHDFFRGSDKMQVRGNWSTTVNE